MGDAFLPLGEEVAASLYNNPAHLGRRIKQPPVDWFNLSLFGNQGLVSNFSSSLTSFSDLAAQQAVLAKSPGRWIGGGSTFALGVALPGISVGLLGVAEFLGRQSSPSAASNVQYRSQLQLIPAVGSGFRLFKGRLRLGASVQWVNSAASVSSVASSVASSSTLSYFNNMQQGSALSGLLGLTLIAPLPSLPALNVVVRNAFQTGYHAFSLLSVAQGGSTLPSCDPRTLDVSLSAQPHLERGIVMNVVGVYRDALNATQTTPLAHLALGLEMALHEQVFFRGGWNGGYGSLGVGVKGKKAELNLSYYTEELGASYLSQGDTRFLIQYLIRAL